MKGMLPLCNFLKAFMHLPREICLVFTDNCLPAFLLGIVYCKSLYACEWSY